MAAVGIIVQCPHIFDQSGTKRIKMDVPNEFAQVSLFLSQYRLVTVLEEVSMPVVSTVIIHGMTGQLSSPYSRNWIGSRF